MSISVIIPTYKRIKSLERTLNSLQKQSFYDFEVIVVDNAADKDIERLIRTFNLSAKKSVKYVKHKSGGIAGARNRGVKEATSELLVFTDDDLSFDRNWLSAYYTKFLNYPEMIAAGGRVKPLWEKPPPAWLLKYIGNQKFFGILALVNLYPEFCIGKEVMLAGCNMAIRQSVFDWTGFHPELIGTRTVGDGESGLQNDIIQKGDLVGYVPEAIAYHHIPAQRMTVRYIRKWAWHLGGCQMYTRWRNRKRTFMSLSNEALSIVKQYREVWLNDFKVRGRRDKKAIDIQFQASLGWCKLRYIVWMISDSKVRKALKMRDFRP